MVPGGLRSSCLARNVNRGTRCIHRQYVSPSRVFHVSPPLFASSALAAPFCLLVSFLLLGLAGRASTRTDSPVVVTEIRVSDPAGSSDSEWIELHCLSGVNVDLSGWSLQGGINYTFPEGTVITGRGYLVVAANPGASNLAGVTALGPYSGALSNSGAEIMVVNRNGRVMDDVNYQDSGDWPVGPDGPLVAYTFPSVISIPGMKPPRTGPGAGPWEELQGRIISAMPGRCRSRPCLHGCRATWKYFDAGTAP